MKSIASKKAGPEGPAPILATTRPNYIYTVISAWARKSTLKGFFGYLFVVAYFLRVDTSQAETTVNNSKYKRRGVSTIGA